MGFGRSTQSESQKHDQFRCGSGRRRCKVELEYMLEFIRGKQKVLTDDGDHKWQRPKSETTTLRIVADVDLETRREFARQRVFARIGICPGETIKDVQ